MRITILLFFVFQYFYSFACCAERMYKLYPLGEVNNKVVFVEFNLYRSCNNYEGGGSKNEFWLNGTINLVEQSSDSLLFIENIDTIKIKECVCTYKNIYEKSEYENLIEKYYNKSLAYYKNKDNFKIATTINVVFNDTLNTKITEEITDSTYVFLVKYKDFFKIELTDIISCFPKIPTIKTYRTENYKVIIIRLRCRDILNEAIQHNKVRFKNIETAFWKEKAQWHGVEQDYYFINKNFE